QSDGSPGTGRVRLHFIQELLNFCQVIAFSFLKAGIDRHTASLLIDDIVEYIPAAESGYFSRISFALIKLLQNGDIGVIHLFVAIDTFVIRLARQNLVISRIGKGHLIGQINLTATGSVAMDCSYISYRFPDEWHEHPSARLGAIAPKFFF